MDLDKNVRSLLGPLNTLFDIVEDLKNRQGKLEELQEQGDLLKRIAQQTTECCYFVRSYMGHSVGTFIDLHVFRILLLP